MNLQRLWRAVALGPLERRLFWIVVAGLLPLILLAFARCACLAGCVGGEPAAAGAGFHWVLRRGTGIARTAPGVSEHRSELIARVPLASN